ncbi:hypothetical protein PHSC3_001003 [Chlamydiales bacterium STE3]|nr:hypothetical protein PHSC3_001003 [Chlamydiales bacterium STE3]
MAEQLRKSKGNFYHIFTYKMNRFIRLRLGLFDDNPPLSKMRFSKKWNVMHSARFMLQKINGLLDELIDVATALEKLSLEVKSEEEINTLQLKQEQIINELLQLDEHLHGDFPELEHEKLKEKELIRSKMAKFQKLNDSFIDNLENGSGLINFE